MVNSLEYYYDEFNSPNGEKRKKIIEYLVDFYGEKHREYIEREVANTTVIMIGDTSNGNTIHGIKNVISRLKEETKKQFAYDNGLPLDEKGNIIEEFYKQNGAKYDEIWKTKYEEDYLAKQKLAEAINWDLFHSSIYYNEKRTELNKQKEECAISCIEEISKLVSRDLGLDILDGLKREVDITSSESSNRAKRRLKFLDKPVNYDNQINYILLASYFEKSIKCKLNSGFKEICFEFFNKLGYKIDIDEVENNEIYQAILKSNIKYADIVKDEVFNLDLIKQKAKEHVEQLDIGLDKREIVDLIKKWGITENNAFHATYLADTGLKGIICLPYGFDSDDVLLHEFNHALGRHLIDRDGFKKYDCYNGFVKCSQWKRKSSDGRYIYNTEEQSLYNIFNEIVTEYLATRMVDEMKRDHKFINGFNSEHRCTYTLTMNMVIEVLDKYYKDLKETIFSDDPVKYMREKIGNFDFLRLVRVLDKLEWITDDDIVAIERLAGGAENMDNFIQNFSKEDIEKLRRTDEELADFIEDIEKLNEIVDQILSLSPRINPMD